MEKHIRKMPILVTFQNQELAEIWQMVQDEIRAYAGLILGDKIQEERVIAETEKELSLIVTPPGDIQQTILLIKKIFWQQAVDPLYIDQAGSPQPISYQESLLDEMISDALRLMMKKANPTRQN